jgi:hypothetical protein
VSISPDNPMPSGKRVLRCLPNGAPWGDPSKAPRCGARCRDGRPCRQPAVKGRRTCRMHGGTGGAPKGRRNGNWRHGRRTRAAEAEARRFGAVIRHMHKVARSVEESVRELRPLFTPIRYVVERVRVDRGGVESPRSNKLQSSSAHPHPNSMAASRPNP